MRALLASTIALILLGSCTRPPAPAPAPRPVPIRPLPATMPAPPPSSDWRDWPITPGAWSVRHDTRGSVALFGLSGAEATVMLRCDRMARTISLLRAGSAGTGGFTIRTTTMTRALPAVAAPPYAAATLAPDDRLLDAIGFSRGRFLVETAPLPALVVPAWPEILRVVEDCRS